MESNSQQGARPGAYCPPSGISQSGAFCAFLAPRDTRMGLQQDVGKSIMPSVWDFAKRCFACLVLCPILSKKHFDCKLGKPSNSRTPAHEQGTHCALGLRSSMQLASSKQYYKDAGCKTASLEDLQDWRCFLLPGWLLRHCFTA